MVDLWDQIDPVVIIARRKVGFVQLPPREAAGDHGACHCSLARVRSAPHTQVATRKSQHTHVLSFAEFVPRLLESKFYAPALLVALRLPGQLMLRGTACASAAGLLDLHLVL